MSKKWAKYKGRRKKKRLSRWFQKIIMSGVNQIDFVKLLNRVSQTSVGKPWREKFADLPNQWPRPDELRVMAIELTHAQLEKESRGISLEAVEAAVDAIHNQYDHESVLQITPALTGIMDGLYDSPAPDRPFTSPDNRELLHLDELKHYIDQGLGVVYLVNHSSHLDEFLVGAQFLQTGLGMPLFAAGANMMAIPSLARFFRLGSYVVQRRRARRTELAALFNYCRAISDVGGQQSIFLEAWHGGARSRDGSLRYPRRLVTLRGAIATEKDLVVQPVALSYAQVPEDLSLAARASARVWFRGVKVLPLLGRMLVHPKSFVWRCMQNLWGRAYMTMPKPRLLSELQAEHAQDPGGLQLDEFVALNAIREIARTKKVMASQLTARAMAHGRQSGKRNLLDSAKAELERLTDYHQSTFNQEPDLEDLIRDSSLEAVLQDGIATLKQRGVLARWGKDPLGMPHVLSPAGLSFYATHGDRRIYSPTANQNIVVVGAGDWGFALTYAVGHRILDGRHYLNASLTLYDQRPEVARIMGETRRPLGAFEDYTLPKNSFVTSDPVSAFRKASEVIIASAPSELAAQAHTILENSDQAMSVIVAACGFDTETHQLPYKLFTDIKEKLGREDVELYSLVGPVTDQDLVRQREVWGILAGPGRDLKRLSDLLHWPPLGVELSPDPLGVQAAAVLARIYALWGNVLTRGGRVRGAAQVGAYVANAAREATRLGLALGGKAETFTAASPAWTSVFTAEGLGGPTRDLGQKIGMALKKEQDVPVAAKKAVETAATAGVWVPVYTDLRSAQYNAKRLGLDLPILKEAFGTIWGEEDSTK